MRNWLQDKYILLTGASGGIGRELTKILIRKYHAKIIGIGRSEEKMQALLKELGSDNGAFSYKILDVSQKQCWEKLYEDLNALNIRPVLLLNNAGVFPPLQLVDNGYSQIVENTLQTNFLATVYAVECISPLLTQNGKYPPAIVNVCSSAALCPVVGSAAYSASKSALKGYTEALQLEEKGKKYVGIIYPGTTMTDLFRDDSKVQGSAMEKIATPAHKMAKKIAKRIYKRKKRSILGWDAKCMATLAKIMPVKGPALIRWVMKISKSQAFDNVFGE